MFIKTIILKSITKAMRAPFDCKFINGAMILIKIPKIAATVKLLNGHPNAISADPVLGFLRFKGL